MKLLRVSCGALSLFACTFPFQRAESRPPLDRQSAVDAGDVTALIEGCGVPLTTGFLVCRKTEGEIAGDSLSFVGPPVTCSGREACITFKIFFLDGTPSLGGAIPRGKTRVEVPWKSILKRDTFESRDRGLWGFSYTIRYTLSDGIERTTYSQGEIYLRVIKKGYTPLNTVEQDRDFTWEWKEGAKEIKATSGMRTYVGPP